MSKNKKVVESVKEENGIKVTRYAPMERKPVPMQRCNRKPVYGPKAP